MSAENTDKFLMLFISFSKLTPFAPAILRKTVKEYVFFCKFF